MVVCKFFFQGECRFGENCKFEHQFPSGYSGSTENQQFRHNQNPNKVFASKIGNDADVNPLITSIRNDMLVNEKSGQWILSCYAPFPGKPAFPGFQDQSFEEVRLGCYEAKKSNTFEAFQRQLQQSLIEARNKFKALQNPTAEIVQIIKNIQSSPATNTTGSIFSNKPTTSDNIFGQTNANYTQGQSMSIFGQQHGGSIFGQQNMQQQNNGGMLGQRLENKNLFTQGQPNSASIFASPSGSIFGVPPQNKQVHFVNPTVNQQIYQQPNSQFDQSSQISQNTPIFNQASQTNPNPQMSSSIFNQSPNYFSNNQPNQAGTIFNSFPQNEQNKSIFGNSISAGGEISDDAYSKLEELSEADIQWFNSNNVDIQTMPEKPPTREMCFV